MLAGLTSLSMTIDGVCTFWEDDVPVVARVAAALGLPGNDPEAIDAARSKRLTLLETEKKGLPTPRFASISASPTATRWTNASMLVITLITEAWPSSPM